MHISPDRDARDSPSGEVVIEIESISKHFNAKGSNGAQALDGVSFSVRKGEFVSIIGPSGCGKSTVLRCIAGLLRPDNGAVYVDGTVVTEPVRDVGIAFQDPLLLDWRTVISNVTLQLEFRKIGGDQDRARAKQLLLEVGLGEFENYRPWQLSGGMRQRVALCRALVHLPSILLLDEPFSALDMLSREQLNSDLMKLCAEYKTTTVLITHSVEEAVFLGDRVLVMSHRPGKIVADVLVDIERGDPHVRQSSEFRRTAEDLRELLSGVGAFNASTSAN